MNPNVSKRCKCPVCQSAEGHRCHRMPKMLPDIDCFDCEACTKYQIAGNALESDKLNNLPRRGREALSQRIRSCFGLCSENELPRVVLYDIDLHVEKHRIKPS